MHKREHYEQLRQYTEIEDEAKQRLAQSRSELENLQARTVFQKQYPSQDFCMPPRPSTSSYLDGPLLMLAQVFKSCVFSNQRCKLTRIRRRRFLRLPRSGNSRCPCLNRIFRFLVPRHSSNSDPAFFRPIRTQPDLQRVHSSLHDANSASHQPPALPPVSDYLATSSSLDTRVPAFCDTIDRLSGCLERVVTKVAEGAISSQSSSSRHHVVQKTEESTLHPLRIAYCTCLLFLFSASVPAASCLMPIRCRTMCGPSVASPISTLPLVPYQFL